MLDLGMSRDGQAHVITRIIAVPDPVTQWVRVNTTAFEETEEWRLRLLADARNLRPRRYH